MSISQQSMSAGIPDTIRHELDRHAALFDTVERSPLTLEQRVAAATMADRQLLIAAAGSGKTSSMVGKVAYAIAGGHARPEQILVLAFNRKAALELQERLGRNEAVIVRTLHALGLDIVTRENGHRPSVQDHAQGLLQKVLRRLVHHDIEFADRWLLFHEFNGVPVQHPSQFVSRSDWKAFVHQHGYRQNRRYGFLTLGDELVPTQFEQAIANWLHRNDVSYVYAPVPVSWSRRSRIGMRRSMSAAFRQPLSGRSGFCLVQTGAWILCLDGRSRPVRYSGAAMVVYLDEFYDASVFATLRRMMASQTSLAGPNRISSMLERPEYRTAPAQMASLKRFIAIARLNGISPEMLGKAARNAPDLAHERLHIPMLAGLLRAYQEALDAVQSIDFEGMLHQAADALDALRHRHGYTLIMVDEFQDTSRGGLRLLKSLLAQNDQCKFFAVGDDWQSIYRFAGAVPDVLSRFEHHFGPSVVHHLTATFRFDQRVADLASRFIQANPAQLRKSVVARPPCERSAVVLARYASIPHMYALCEECLCDISRWKANASDRLTRVYILGRYQHQRPACLEQWQRRFPLLDIQYLTVHSSKGLEADTVIVLGLHTGRHGFPSGVPDDPLMAWVMPKDESFPDAEERRLFYVAITRTRYRLYLLACLHEPSSFVTELLQDEQDYQEIRSCRS